MAAVLYGAQHREDCQLWFCIGWIWRLTGADNKK
jgi:hypothetical protein